MPAGQWQRALSAVMTARMAARSQSVAEAEEDVVRWRSGDGRVDDKEGQREEEGKGRGDVVRRREVEPCGGSTKKSRLLTTTCRSNPRSGSTRRTRRERKRREHEGDGVGF